MRRTATFNLLQCSGALFGLQVLLNIPVHYPYDMHMRGRPWRTTSAAAPREHLHCSTKQPIAAIGIPARMAGVLRIGIAAAARPSSPSLLRSLPAFLTCSRKAAPRPPIGRGLHTGAGVMSGSSTDFKVRTGRRGAAGPAGAWLASAASSPISTPFAASQEYLFGPWKIAAEEVFVTSPHSFAFVNLKPVRRPGPPATDHAQREPPMLACC